MLRRQLFTERFESLAERSEAGPDVPQCFILLVQLFSKTDGPFAESEDVALDGVDRLQGHLFSLDQHPP